MNSVARLKNISTFALRFTQVVYKRKPETNKAERVHRHNDLSQKGNKRKD